VDAREECGRAITAAAQRGASLARQLLVFSRPEPNEPRLVDLNGVLHDFAPMLGRVIGEDVALELRLDARRLPVEVDPVRIDQVLMNIAVNARDAMPNGGRLTIETTAVEIGATRAAHVTLTDTGCGMDAATQARIFDPFFSTKSPAKGTGLGLSTAAGIVEDAGGSITVSSTPGQGTTFGVFLPLAAGEPRTAVAAEREPTPAYGGSETVLVVEDEPALCELERLMLEEAGYDVLSAANAAEALVAAAEHAIDVLLVDVVMPGMSGPRLVDELAARGHDVPAVFVSGYGADEILSRGLETPANAVIQKPFGAEVLLRKVREVLDEASVPPRRGYAGTH
jgi:hypothetical protein